MRAFCSFIASALSARRASACAILLGLAAPGCTLITDVDREKIPDPPLPSFPEVDAGTQPGLDASAANAEDAGGASDDAGADAGDAGVLDAGALDDAGLDASSTP